MTWMGPKGKCPYYRGALGYLTTKDKKAIEDGDRDWNDVGTNHQPHSGRGKKQPAAS